MLLSVFAGDDEMFVVGHVGPLRAGAVLRVLLAHRDVNRLVERGFVPALNDVGDIGRGLYVVLESLQLTRTVCTVLSLGAADHGLRIALECTRGHARSTDRILGEAAALHAQGQVQSG